MRSILPTKGTLIVIGALALGGLVFPYLLLLAGILTFIVLQDMFTPRPVPSPPAPPRPPPRRLIVTAADSDWKAPFLEFCESPAEATFLETVISAYRLLPEKGILKGSGLSLELQVEKKPYRLDFLADGWLAVEIDGATYHSSPEAVAADAVRDDALRFQGFTVLRIPATIVFRDKAETIRRLRTALLLGPQQRPGPISLPKPAPATATVLPAAAPMSAVSQSFGQHLNAANSAVEAFNRKLDIEAARQQASGPARIAFEMEKAAITRCSVSRFHGAGLI
ncbi:endonuclease domain-containing protein [Teichococcus oryzae]|uniref:DUF559 domain-containing protein n=1 Tax=Teichococcus oryzae TaxID=1608942 RepID=A0A5B2TAX9_9PROT|nr:DUF559 domain-containing protein [Pseudoroseomonas oryzae]KAA2211254.1 DUF559 domain-containing protein [Pseudoroseomonas oryzae]